MFFIFIFRKRDTQFGSKLCTKGKKDYADIASRGKGVFLDACREGNNDN